MLSVSLSPPFSLSLCSARWACSGADGGGDTPVAAHNQSISNLLHLRLPASASFSAAQKPGSVSPNLSDRLLPALKLLPCLRMRSGLLYELSPEDGSLGNNTLHILPLWKPPGEPIEDLTHLQLSSSRQHLHPELCLPAFFPVLSVCTDKSLVVAFISSCLFSLV